MDRKVPEHPKLESHGHGEALQHFLVENEVGELDLATEEVGLEIA